MALWHTACPSTLNLSSLLTASHHLLLEFFFERKRQPSNSSSPFLTTSPLHDHNHLLALDPPTTPSLHALLTEQATSPIHLKQSSEVSQHFTSPAAPAKHPPSCYCSPAPAFSSPTLIPLISPTCKAHTRRTAAPARFPSRIRRPTGVHNQDQKFKFFCNQLILKNHFDCSQINMSASPPTQSAKRPLEETSSPSRTDQPDAKRPALDKILRGDEEELKKDTPSENGHTDVPELPAVPELPKAETKTNGDNEEPKDEAADTSAAPDVAAETKPIIVTHGGPAGMSQTASSATHDESAWIHIRAVITSPEAATIIGKGGENVSKIRQMSNAKCTVSDYQKGAIERILTVSGSVDAVAKVRRSTNVSYGYYC